MSDGLTTAVGGVPLVGIVMGSDSDWPIMQLAADVLAEFGVAHEIGVVSAHRMPEEMVDYGRTAADRGLRVIIAGAGGAAHLPGMLAALTPLPVVGVPVPLANLDGLDSLLSIVQMPAGVPVATVAVGNARNAGLLAVRILAAGDDDRGVRLRAKMATFQQGLNATARAKGKALRDSL
jgi:5-(carboxyamino)imidazole ribonucleotide mutase